MAARTHRDLIPANVTGISTDSRQIKPGDLFFAIKGPNFDGHEYLEQVLSSGAAGVVVNKSAKLPESLDLSRVMVVEDTVIGLGKLAAYYRDKLSCTVIAVTGSNGKTTTKELISHILTKKLRGQRSAKSFNNHIGVPLTLLSADVQDEFLVVEVGTNHPGEIDYLGNIVRPDIAVITNVGESHLEGFGTIERVASEKASIAKHVRSGGAIVVNGDREMLIRLISQPQAMMIRFGTSKDCDMRMTNLTIQGQGLEFQINGKFKIALPVLGSHNAMNCLAAVVVARRMGFEIPEIGEILKNFKLPSMRLELMTLGDYQVLNDAYNANPMSMRSALEVLEQFPTKARRVFCCGQMMELGDQSEQFHRELGKKIGSSTVDVVIFVGGFAAQMAEEAVGAGMGAERIFSFPTSQEAAQEIGTILRKGDLVLVKGSRSMKMERIIESMKEMTEK